MMFPHDPLRQKMLMRTEWRAVLAKFGTDADLDVEVNDAFKQLLDTGFNISQVMPVATGMLVIGQRITSPVSDPTPQGTPIHGTSAQQTIEVVYSFVERGEVKQETMKTFQDAVRVAARDLEESARTGQRQPISIHVVSTTAYNAADLHLLKERFG